MDDPQHPDSAIIDALGGSGRVAELCRVTSQAVSYWRRYGIPQARRMYLQLLRPEVFADRQHAADQRAA